jgi:hypothetical protein
MSLELLHDLTLLYEIRAASGLGFLRLPGAQPELARTRNVLGDTKTRVKNSLDSYPENGCGLPTVSC